MSGTFNLLVAPPKVGKSALMVGMISAWYHGEESYLANACTAHVRRFTSSAPTSLKVTGSRCSRGGLVTSDGELGGPVEMLWHTGAPLHLTDEGITHLGEIAAKTLGRFFCWTVITAVFPVLALRKAPAHSTAQPASSLRR